MHLCRVEFSSFHAEQLKDEHTPPTGRQEQGNLEIYLDMSSPHHNDECDFEGSNQVSFMNLTWKRNAAGDVGN